MKILEIITKAIGSVWKFCANIITISLIAAIVLFGLAVAMPDNAFKVVEILKSVFGV